MSHWRRVFLAGALLGAFAAGLVWLPSMAAAFAFGALLGLAGVYAFRTTRWRTAALLFAAIAGGLALTELASDLVITKSADVGVVKVETPRDWADDDSILGYRPRPGTQVEAVATWRDETVFRRTYTIDGTGARVTPGSAPSGDTYLFIGDSFVFGTGLADDETLPSRFAQAIGAQNVGSKAHVVNLGVPGYGLNQLVRALETGLYDRYVTGQVKAVMTWIIPAQLERVTGDADWLGSSPRYVIGADGMPIYTGSFNAHRLANPLDGLAYLARTKMKSVSIATGRAMDRASADLFVALLSRLRQLVAERYKAPLVVLYQWPLPRPTAQDGLLLPTLEAMERLDTPKIAVSSLIEGDQPTYIIPHDGHPSAVFVRMVARALEAQQGL